MTSDVLLVEDEDALAHSICEYLQTFGVPTQHAPNGATALEAIEAHPPAVAVLDVQLPDMSGYALCSLIRQRWPAIIVIFLSAKDTEADQILGMSLGADDYVTKPFSAQVLLAKVRRALERGQEGPQASARDDNVDHKPTFDDGNLRVDTQAGRVWLAGKEIHLTAIEYRILAYLVARPGQVCSKQAIIEAVWGDPFTSEATLSVHIRRLRQRLGAEPVAYVQTAWGRGYLFEARVRS